MGVSDFKLDENAGPVVDLSAQGIQKLEPSFTCSEETHTLILDHNNIMKLDNLERSPELQQLSVASNRLVRMMGVSRLTELRVLNLPNNSIGYIEGLRDLPQLEWLNLSGNNIKVIEQLHNCISLQHLDLSDNNISNIGDLTKLMALKTLLLHGNSITTLRTVPGYLPAHVSIVSLAENEIQDLNEVSYLAPLQELEQLSIMSNPCVMATPLLPGFDYRPYIMSWCLSLKVLDGYVVSQKESLKAEWLYSQGKGRLYRPGQHVQLVQYLATVCPLTTSPALETAEDAKLEKILSKQRLHQRQLLQQTPGGSPSPPRPTHLDVETHSPQRPCPQGPVVEENRSAVPEPEPGAVASTREIEPTIQYNTWMRSDSVHQSMPVLRSPRAAEESLHLEDVQTDEGKLNGSLLSSDSTFLPVSADAGEQKAAFSESEDETETFEPDSLAPQHPTTPRKPTVVETSHQCPMNKREGDFEEKESHLAVGYNKSDFISKVSAQVAGPIQLQGGLPPGTSSDSGDDLMKERPKQVDNLHEINRAAVRIQSWWRGQFTRHHHPVAREVRSEIRLRRMQEYIVFLSGKLDRMQVSYEEERLQRLVQEEAVKFLWKQLQLMQQWQKSVEEQLASLKGSPAATSASGQSQPVLRVASSTAEPAHTQVSFPDSGFQTTGEQQVALEDSFLSSGTVDSLETVRALALRIPSPSACTACVGGVDGDSADCSLLEQYLSSIQKREEAEDGMTSDRTEISLPPPPLTANKTAQPDSPTNSQGGDKESERLTCPENLSGFQLK